MKMYGDVETAQEGQEAESCSIFVSTRVGQIRNELSFIEEHSPKSPRALVMVSVMDTQLSETLTGMVQTGPFEAHSVAVLPKYPASASSVFRRPKTYRAMRDAFKQLVGSCTDVDLYLHHANRYYAYFEHVMAEVGVKNYRLILLEEGLATYRWAVPGMEDVSSAARLYTPVEALHRLVGEVAEIAKCIARAILHVLKLFGHVGELFLALASKATGRNLFSPVLRVVERFIPRKCRFGVVRHFDAGYFCFPEKMKHVEAFTIDEIHPLSLAINDVRLSGESALHHVDAVFASQRYGNPEIYYEVVFSIFEEIGLRSVFFKLHPREEPDQVLPHLEQAAARHSKIRVVRESKLDSVPLESLLSAMPVQLLIGLTSSTLMYAPLIRANIDVLSIADRFFELYAERDPNGMSGEGMDLKTFREDLRVLRAIAPEIKQFYPKCSKTQLSPGVISDGLNVNLEEKESMSNEREGLSHR